MAKFCTKCGAPLEEGQICSCQQQAQAPVSEPAPAPVSEPAPAPVVEPTPVVTNEQPINPVPAQATPNTFYQPPVATSSNPFKGFAELMKGFFKTPSTAIAKYADNEENFLGSILLIVIQAFVMAVFTILNMIFLVKGFDNMFGNDGLVDAIKIFIVTLFGSALISAAFFGILLLLAVIFQGKANAKKMLNIVSLRSIVVIPLAILGILTGVFNVAIAIALFVLSEFFAMMFTYYGMRGASETADDRLAFVMPIAFVLLLIAFYIVMQIMLNILDVPNMISSLFSLRNLLG